MGRTYAGTQCQNRQTIGDVCGKHKALKFGRIDGDIPSAVLSDFVKRLPAEEQGRACGGAAKSDTGKAIAVVDGQREHDMGVADAVPGAADFSAKSDVQQPESASLLKRRRAAEDGATSSGRRGRIVAGFGEGRVDDVVADERSRIAEGARRGDKRREEGQRGRVVHFMSGADIDRSAGGAWHLGRR